MAQLTNKINSFGTNRENEKGKKRKIKFNHPKEMETDLISCEKTPAYRIEDGRKKRGR